ncbi:hypothetical protein [Micromonospora pallida]|uniref:hypothetical protein n=1 Tax=Micromonospora pallida TaxID=145854 RepID=UPI001C406DD2|nr:hypothetical protein [Micromonospora pallida]
MEIMSGSFVSPTHKARGRGKPGTLTQRRGSRPSTRRLASVALAAAACISLAACQFSRPAGPAQPSRTVSSSEFSTLDAAGVERIRSERRARLDLSSGKLMKSAVGLTDSSYGPEINTRREGKIALSIAAPKGTIEARTDRIRFNTTNARPDFSEVTYFLTASSAEEFFALIRDGVQKYGIDSDSAEGWISSASADPGMQSDFSITSGTSTGLEVNYDLRFDGSKDIQVIIVHISPAE